MATAAELESVRDISEDGDEDRDSLHVLPLFIIPFETPAVKRARLVKNVRLESMVEFFKDEKTGSGQMEISQVGTEFGWEPNTPNPDWTILRKLGKLPSFDVYSLRVTLRGHGIPVNDFAELKLSEKKSKELASYMTSFTRPLIAEIYGGEDVSIQSFEDVLALFMDPDIEKARQQLKKMARKLEIKVEDIPRFMEDYGDIFLSLSYYRQVLDEISPIAKGFLESLDEIRENWQLKSDPSLMQTCGLMETAVKRHFSALNRRFLHFDHETKDMWSEITAQRFRRVERMIESYHINIGGVLCAMSLKMNAWAGLLPNSKSGGLRRRAEFIMSEMKQGIDTIQKVEEETQLDEFGG
jgi:hypothetical protein